MKDKNLYKKLRKLWEDGERHIGKYKLNPSMSGYTDTMELEKMEIHPISQTTYKYLTVTEDGKIYTNLSKEKQAEILNSLPS